MSTCAGTKRNVELCTVSALSGERFCYNHHPDHAEERKLSARRAATAKHTSVGKELRGVRELYWELLELAITDRLPLRVNRHLQSVIQLLQCYRGSQSSRCGWQKNPCRRIWTCKG